MPGEDSLSFVALEDEAAVEDAAAFEEEAVVGVEVAEDGRDIVERVSKFHGPAVKSVAG